MSDIIKDGGPAFPSEAWDNCAIPGCIAGPMRGMSLRDWFAGMSMQGMLAANVKMHVEATEKNIDQIIAREAYLSADAMLNERDNPTPTNP